MEDLQQWTPITIIEAENGRQLYLRLIAIAGRVLGGERGPDETIVPAGYEAPYMGARALRRALDNEQAEVWAIPYIQDGLQVGITWAAWDTDSHGELIRPRVAYMQHGIIPAAAGDA